MLFLLLLGGAAGALEVHRLVQRRSAPGGDAELQTLRQRERVLKQALQARSLPPPPLPWTPHRTLWSSTIDSWSERHLHCTERLY